MFELVFTQLPIPFIFVYIGMPVDQIKPVTQTQGCPSHAGHAVELCANLA